jgi:hypothetical protein
MKPKEQINARQAKIEEIKGVAAKDVMTQADKQRDDIERARHNKELEKYQQIQANTAAQRAKFDREDRPSAQDKNILTVMARLNADPDYRAMLKKRDGFQPGDAEFEAIQDYLDSKRDAAYKDLKLPAPTKGDRLQPAVAPVEPGFFKSMRMSTEDKEALAWANANPRDPRSKEIKSKLGF